MFTAQFDDPSPAYTPTPRPAMLSLSNDTRRLPTLPRHYSSNSGSSTSSVTPHDVEKVVHTYTLTAGSANLQFSIAIEPIPPNRGQYLLFLILRTGSVERLICNPVSIRLQMDPHKVHFAVFMFPTKSSLPEGCLYSLRVWLHANDVDHRLFSEDSLWVGRDPDFYSIKDAMFARLRNTTPDSQMYRIVLGRELIDLIIRWQPIARKVYSLSLEYDANGVGRVLFNDCIVRLDCPPTEVQFTIYMMPISSTPPGASHRIRVWLRSPVPPAYPSGPASSSASNNAICQRIWATDNFKIGHMLDFSKLGSKLIMGVPSQGGPQTKTSVSEKSLYRKDTLKYHEEQGYQDFTREKKIDRVDTV